MADIRISAATDIVTLNATDMLPVARSGDTSSYHATMTELKAFAISGVVTSWNTRIGAVTLTAGDVDSALGFTPYNVTNPAGYQTAAQVTTSLAPYAPLASPTFSGTVTLAADPAGALQAATKQYVDAHTPAGGASITVGDTAPASPASGALWWDSVGGQLYLWYADPNSSQWVATSSQAVGGGSSAGVTSWNTRTGAVVLSSADVTGALTFTPYNATNPSGYQTAAQVATAVAPALNNVGRNLLHNGLFNVQQRGTGSWSASGYTVDRWRIDFSLDTVAASVTPFTITGTAGDEEAASAMLFTVTGNAGAAAFSHFNQRVENVKRLSGKTITISFVGNVQSGTARVGVGLSQIMGTGGSPSGGASVNATAVTLTTTPTRYSVSLAVPSLAGATLGTNNDSYTSIRLYFSSGATNNALAGGIGVQSAGFVLWGMQLEIGSVATPLEKLEYGDDLRHCQRFFSASKLITSGTGAAAADRYMSSNLPAEMHATPTVTPTGVTLTNCGSLSAGAYGASAVYLHVVIAASGEFVASISYTASADL